MILKGKGGIQYNLEQNPFAQGGEGKVFNIIGKPNLVAKLYKNGLNDLQKEKKLLAMTNNPPSQEVMSQIAWPQDVLYDNNVFVGFVMPKLKINEDLNVIYEYGPSSKYPNVPWSNKIIIAKNLCAVLDAVHEANHVVGDLNPKNISVDPNTGHIIFVDTDSYHIEDNGSIYRCNVGMPEYLPVEIQKKMKSGLTNAPLPTFTKASDNFALAIHIFQLLMNGTHPFSCRVLPSQSSVVYPQPSDNILNGDFPFVNPKSGTSIPAFAPPFKILPDEMQQLFKRAFVNGHTNPDDRPSPVEWYNALTNLEKQLKKCNKVNHHEYYNKLGQCPWCEADSNFAHNIVSAKKTSLSQSTISKSMSPSVVHAPKPSSSYQGGYKRSPSTFNNHYSINRKEKIYTIVSLVILILTIGLAIPLVILSKQYAILKNDEWVSDLVYCIIFGIWALFGLAIPPLRKRLWPKLISIGLIIFQIIAISIAGNALNEAKEASKPVYLETPSGLSVESGALHWNNVENASSYTIKIGDNEYHSSTNSYFLDQTIDAGNYNVSVKAISDSSNINSSNFSSEISITRPIAPKNITISNNFLEWDLVQNYTNYKIVDNGFIIDTISDTSYSLVNNLIKLQEGENNLCVVVAGDSNGIVDSAFSKGVKINKLNAPLNINIKDDVLSWQPVTNATGYTIQISGNSYSNIFSLDENVSSYYLLGKLPIGDYSIAIQAKGNDNDILSSSFSNAYSYKVSTNVIYINSKNELVNMSADLNAKYILNADIDISDIEWKPIGNISNRFNGALVGNGHSITGLTIRSNSERGTGFFGILGANAKISDVSFDDVYIETNNLTDVGAVAGLNYGTIFNIKVHGTVISFNDGSNIGGIVGRSFGSVYDCESNVIVKGQNNVGGVIGSYEFSSPNLVFSDCKNINVVNGTTNVGGVVGYIRVTRLCYITKLFNDGEVTASSNYAGGIIGYIEGVSGQTGNVDSCLNNGNVTGYSYVGGCFGYVGNYINIVTSNPSDTSKECNNTGNVVALSGKNYGNIKGN